MACLEGLVALITGGAMGIGLSSARELLKRKFKAVVFTDVNRTAGEKAQIELCKEFGPNKVLFMQVDSRNENKTRQAFQRCVDDYGSLDVFFNNAGIIDENVWTNTIDINFIAAINNMHIAFDFIRNYKQKEHGVILNNCSIVGINPFEMLPVYSGSKHGLITYSRAYFSEESLKCTKTKIMCLCPGITLTNILAQGGSSFLEKSKTLPEQTMEQCGEHVGKIIESDKHGSIWVSEGGQLYEVKFPEKGENRIPIPDPEHVPPKPCEQ